jgi:hypothetical protein
MPLRFAILLLLLVAWPPARALETIVSQSQQFAIYRNGPPIITERVPEGSVVVEPQFLAVTAERVKQALTAEIPALGSGGRRIHLYVMERASEDGVFGIVSTKFTDGWNYRVAVPPVANELRLMKALIQVLLLEYANRVGEKGAELPPWITEGLSQELYYSVGPRLVVDRRSSGWEGSVGDLRARARAIMRTNSPPSFNDLTTLAPPPPGAPAEAFYQSCAHLLVHSLLQTPNGRKNFAAFLQLLPATWNWQTAFRSAYGFQSMLDVEKWWTLATVEFTSRDQRQAYSKTASAQKLDDLLKTRVEIRAATNSLPEIRQLELTALLHENNWTLQRAAVVEKIQQLSLTVPLLFPEVAALAAEYGRTLETYLNKRDKDVRPTLRMPIEVYRQTLVTEAVRRIEALDAKRRSLAPPTISAR